MNTHEPFCAGFFANPRQAEQAITSLIALGFARDHMTVIVPDRFRGQLTQTVSQAEPPTRHAPERILQGAIIGASLGGIALAAILFMSDALGIMMGLMVFVGGGAIAGGFASLILEEGYETGVSEYYTQAMNNNQIVVGVQGDGDGSEYQLAQAARILKNAGAISLAPQEDPTKHSPAETPSTGGGAMAGV